MQKLTFVICLLLTLSYSFLGAQALLLPSGNSGGAYTTIMAANFGLEAPDETGSSSCMTGGMGDHTPFGDHVTQTFDSDLDENVFIFHSHINDDSDRCINFDRIRTELKGGGNSYDLELSHENGDTSYYTWQFQIASDFQGSNKFCHLFQNKAQGGTDSGFPIITITARESIMEVLHDAGEMNPAGDQGQLISAPLSAFKGEWVEVFMRQIHKDDGEFYIKVSDISTGSVIMEYENTNIDMWRDGMGVMNRPKFGIYRSLDNPTPAIKDEEVRFAGFCSSESSATICPSYLSFNGSGDLPEVAEGLLPKDGVVDVPTNMPLIWNTATGADSYNVYFGTSTTPPLVTNTTDTIFSPTLAANTTYYFQIGSVNTDGERFSALHQFTTLVNPNDGTWEVVRGHARPEIEAPLLYSFFTDIIDPPSIDEVECIEDDESNAAYCFFSGPKDINGNDDYRWRNDLNDGDVTTIVVRLRPINGNTNLTFIEFRGLGWRQKIRINQNDVKFESAPGDPTVDFPNDYWGPNEDLYKVLRFTFEKDINDDLITTFYRDEETTPLASYISDTPTSSDYIDIGRAGGTDYGACFDYIAVNATGAFAPDDSPSLPADLKLPTVPGTFNALLPLDCSDDVPLYMPLVWSSATDAVEYNVYLGTDPNSLSNVATVVDTMYSPTLLENTTYYYAIGASNGNGETLSDTLTFTTLTVADDGNWEVARGHARPEVEASQFFTFNTNLSMIGIDSVGRIAEEGCNNAYCFFSGPKEDGNSNYKWRYDQDDGEESTVVIRLRPIVGESNITYVEFRGVGWRQKLRINKNSIKFESSTNDPEASFPAGFWDDGEFHILRITHEDDPGGAITTVYLDENPTPFAAFASATTTTSDYIEFGRAGGEDYGACYDYLAFNSTGVFPPNTGVESFLPPDLILPVSDNCNTDNITTTSDVICLDDPQMGICDNVLIDYGSASGTVEACVDITTTGSPTVVESGNSLTLTAGTSITLKACFHAKAGSTFQASIEDCNNANETVENRSEEIWNSNDALVLKLKVQPNPAYEVWSMQIYASKESAAQIQLLDITGKIVRIINQRTLLSGWNTIDVFREHLSDGIYFLNLRTPDKSITEKVILAR